MAWDEREMREKLGWESQLHTILENTDPQPAPLHHSGWENAGTAFPEKLWNVQPWNPPVQAGKGLGAPCSGGKRSLPTHGRGRTG